MLKDKLSGLHRIRFYVYKKYYGRFRFVFRVRVFPADLYKAIAVEFFNYEFTILILNSYDNKKS